MAYRRYSERSEIEEVMMIKAVIFDIGGVLFRERLQDRYPQLARIMGYDLKKFYKVREKYIGKAQAGKFPSEGYIGVIAREMKVKDFKKFKKTWIKLVTKTTKKKKDVERIIIKLKKKYIIGTLTNITPINHKIRLKKKAYKHFKIKVISYKEGCRKPGMKIYRLLIKRLKIKPREIVLIEDKKENLVPAKKLGMKTIVFENAKQLKKDLRKLGIEI